MSMTGTGTGTIGSTNRFYAKSAPNGMTSTTLLQAGHTLATRVRNTTASTTGDGTPLSWSMPSSANGSYIGRVSGGAATRMDMYRTDNVTVNTTNAVGAYGSTTAWVHLGFVYDGTTIRSYVDGVASGTIASTNTYVGSASSTSDYAFGCGLMRAVFVDSVFFTRALSAADMLNLANYREPQDKTGLVGWYPHWADDFVRDFSGNGNDMTVTGSAGTAPAVSNENPPISWTGPRAWFFVPTSTPVALVSTASNTVTGASASADVAAPLASTASSTVTAASAILQVPTALSSTASSTVTSASASARVAAPLASTASSTVTSASASATVAAPLASTASSTTTAASASAQVAAPLASTASSTTTAASASLQTPIALASTASSTTTSASATARVAAPLASTASSTITAADGTLSLVGQTALVSTASNTQTAASATLTVGAPLASTASSTTTAAAASAQVAAPLASTASSTTTSAAATLGVVVALVSTASSTTTGALADVVTAAPLFSTASSTTTSFSAFLTLSVPLTSVASATTTSASGFLSGGTAPVGPSGPGQGPGFYKGNINRRNMSITGRRSTRFGR